MTTTARSASAVITGAILWALLWVGGAAIARAIWPDIIPAGARLDHTGALIGYLVLSVVISVLAGGVTARIAEGNMRAVYILAAIQLLLGLAIEVGGWHLAPAWYHIAFLVLLAPAILWGGRMGLRTARTTHVAVT
jgi:hypothetical protein